MKFILPLFILATSALHAAAFPEGSLQRAVFQSIPSTWDETVILDVSKPGGGHLAIFRTE